MVSFNALMKPGQWATTKPSRYTPKVIAQSSNSPLCIQHMEPKPIIHPHPCDRPAPVRPTALAEKMKVASQLRPRRMVRTVMVMLRACGNAPAQTHMIIAACIVLYSKSAPLLKMGLNLLLVATQVMEYPGPVWYSSMLTY